MNEEARTLARVAIEARERFWRRNPVVTVGNHNKVLWTERERDFVAAAIDRHMVKERTLMNGDRVLRPGSCVTVCESDTFDNLYRITQEPRGGEDATD